MQSLCDILTFVVLTLKTSMTFVVIWRLLFMMRLMLWNLSWRNDNSKCWDIFDVCQADKPLLSFFWNSTLKHCMAAQLTRVTLPVNLYFTCLSWSVHKSKTSINADMYGVWCGIIGILIQFGRFLLDWHSVANLQWMLDRLVVIVVCCRCISFCPAFKQDSLTLHLCCNVTGCWMLSLNATIKRDHIARDMR